MPDRLSRRRFLAVSGAAAVAVLAPQSLMQAQAAPRADRHRLLRGGSFGEGVLSGDPTPHGITLMARVADADAPGRVLLEVAKDPGFTRVVARKRIATGAKAGHNVKARVTGLDPGERYYYRFQGGTAESPAGRFQTALPADSNEPVRFAFVSCQEFTLGHYNAHRLLAREDVDFVVNLGDYIYGDLAMGPPVGVRDLPAIAGDGDALNFADYCRRYSAYRSDPALRAVHAKFPMVSCWSDHEVQDNYAGAAPRGGDVTTGPYSRARRNAGYRAFFRSMPTFAIGRQRLYHRARFGKHVDLFVLDERQYRQAQPCLSETGAPACPELPHPRAFLGRQQNEFLRSGLTRSDASWKVIANEVVMMGLKTDPTHYDMFDAWHGYPAEREALLQVIRRRAVEDVVFITGDYHAFMAGDVQTRAGHTVATEFVGGSLSSPTVIETQVGTGRYGTLDEPTIPPEELAGRLAANPYYKELDPVSHGYVVCEASPKRFKATFRKIRTVRRESLELKPETTHVVRRGRPGL